MNKKYTCFDLEIKNKVAYVTMCRPEEFNTMNKAFWSELPHLVEKISDDASARVIVLSSNAILIKGLTSCVSSPNLPFT